jgi:hypothetical protein
MSKWRFLIGMMTGIFFLTALLVAGAGRVLNADDSRPVLIAKEKKTGEEEIENESDFWSIFQRLFTASEPEYEDEEVRHTEVAGVRGIEREGKMEKVYDWESVRWMEEYEVKPEQVKSFLEKARLGPYQEKGKERKS